MIKKIILCILTIVVITAKSQSPFPSPFAVSNVDWVRIYSQADLINGAPTTIDANSNVFSTGYIGTLGSRDLLVLKYDSTGTQVFAYTYNNGGDDEGRAIKIDASGNSYIGGMSEDNVNGTGQDYVIMKLSPTGALLWSAATRFDGAGGRDVCNDICVDANGDVYVTGQSQNVNGNFDVVSLKIDGNTGTILWQHTYAGASNLDDVGNSMVLSSDGQRLFITGYSTHATNGKDIITYALKTGSGSYDWAAPVITNGPSNGDDLSNGIILTGGNITICGEMDNASNGSGKDYISIKYDGSNGAILWQQDYDGYSGNDRATALAKDSAGNIGVVGIVDNGGFVEYHTIFYDSTGTRYTDNIEPTGLTAPTVDPTISNDTIAHHWYCSGEILRATKDIFVYQITPAGTTSWREALNGQDNDVDAAVGVVVNGVGVVYVGGFTKNSLGVFDYTTIKINQTPCYWPPDFAGEPVNNGHLYLKNEGQLMRTDTTLASEVLYYTHNTKPEIFIEQHAFDIVFKTADTLQNSLDTIERIQYQFLNCNTYAGYHEYQPKLTNYNFYLGYALSTSIENVQGNERIFIPNFYPYIDLHYFSGAGGIKFYFVVKPGALLDELRMQINGAVSNSVDGSGNLNISGNLGNIVLSQPIAYTVNWLGAVTTLTTGSATWLNPGSNQYSIHTPSYNHSWPLIVQVSAQTATVPTVNRANLDYSTYYGGMGNEGFNDIKAAANGDRHVTGWTYSSVFPDQNSMFLYNNGKDAVILKYTADDTLRVASFMGGSRDDQGNSITVNAANEVFVGGTTESSDFPAKSLSGASNQTVNGYVTVADYKDGFLAKFSPTVNTQGKSTLTNSWSRYFGGPGNDEINSICLDGSGNLYFVGEARSSTIAGLVSPAQSSNANATNGSDVILGKFNTSLAMVYGTFLGGGFSPYTTHREVGYDIVVDNNGNAIVCGMTESNTFPVINSTGNTNTFYDNTANSNSSGPRNGFIARYSSTGTKQFASYFGGNGPDQVTRLAYDPVYDDIYFAGDVYDTTAFPFLHKTNALNSRIRTYRNAFVGQMSGDLTKRWCSLYGRGTFSSGNTYTVSSLDVDGSGILYLCGMITSDTIHRPVTQPTLTVYQDSIKNSTEGFVAIFNADQSLYHAHYFGGAGVDQINGADISQSQNLYVVGNTASNDFPIAYTSVNATLIDSVYRGGGDGFISRFTLVNYQVTGIGENNADKTSLKVYPNPTSTGFKLELQSGLSSKVKMEVFNLAGQLIYEQNVTEKSTQVNCESWTNGVYLISVSDDAQSQRTFKLIKN